MKQVKSFEFMTVEDKERRENFLLYRYYGTDKELDDVSIIPLLGIAAGVVLGIFLFCSFN